MEAELLKILHRVLKAEKVSEEAELNHASLMKLNKDPLVNLVEELSNQWVKSLEVCKAVDGVNHVTSHILVM